MISVYTSRIYNAHIEPYLQNTRRKGLGRRIGAFGGDLDGDRLQRTDENADEKNGENDLWRERRRERGRWVGWRFGESQ